MTTTETAQTEIAGPRVNVSIPTTLERVTWTHITSEDYYVRLAGTARILGIVGNWRPDERWTVSGDRDETSNRFARRTYKTRDAAVAALIRYYANTVGVKVS